MVPTSLGAGCFGAACDGRRPCGLPVWCAGGAIEVATWELNDNPMCMKPTLQEAQDDATDTLAVLVEPAFLNLPKWNDDDSQTKEEVLQAFDVAIYKLT